VKLLLDELYPPALAQALVASSIEAFTVTELRLAGWSDSDVLAAGAVDGYVLLTENVADFARIATERLIAGGRHPGVLIALSSRLSRRPGGIPAIAAAVHTLADQHLKDRLVYLEQVSQIARYRRQARAARLYLGVA
jgi:predicted nuclease of predicted toxin-antitoxin system